MKQEGSSVAASMAWDNKSITLSDFGRILKQIQEDLGNDSVSLRLLHQLYLMTAVGKKYDPENIPDDVVTMNSEILLSLEDNKKMKVRIVYPGDVNNPGDISLYSPIGLACLGEHENSQVHYFDGTARRQAVIEKILFQPEKEKLFFL